MTLTTDKDLPLYKEVEERKEEGIFGKFDLPLEVFQTIITFLDPASIFSCLFVNRTWRVITNDKYTWRLIVSGNHNLSKLFPVDYHVIKNEKDVCRYYALLSLLPKIHIKLEKIIKVFKIKMFGEFNHDLCCTNYHRNFFDNLSIATIKDRNLCSLKDTALQIKHKIDHLPKIFSKEVDDFPSLIHFLCGPCFLDAALCLDLTELSEITPEKMGKTPLVKGYIGRIRYVAIQLTKGDSDERLIQVLKQSRISSKAWTYGTDVFPGARKNLISGEFIWDPRLFLAIQKLIRTGSVVWKGGASERAQYKLFPHS